MSNTTGSQGTAPSATVFVDSENVICYVQIGNSLKMTPEEIFGLALLVLKTTPIRKKDVRKNFFKKISNLVLKDVDGKEYLVEDPALRK